MTGKIATENLGVCNRVSTSSSGKLVPLLYHIHLKKWDFMEFFEELESTCVDIQAIQNLLQIYTLPDYCESIDSVLSDNQNVGEIYCLWGQFNVSRKEIRNGIRFALLNCPHALAWTITYHTERRKLVVHCTIDDQETDPDFADSIKIFISDWSKGLNDAFPETA